ncbi:MAG: hypothetical protein ABTD50_21965 [Polyangiaceae bacterium]|jgi:hypothetical protein
MEKVALLSHDSTPPNDRDEFLTAAYAVLVRGEFHDDFFAIGSAENAIRNSGRGERDRWCWEKAAVSATWIRKTSRFTGSATRGSARSPSLEHSDETTSRYQSRILLKENSIL